MNASPLVSIIIPAYNTSEYIAGMLQDVFNQTYKNIEIIVVDDGSTDNTIEIITEFNRMGGVRIVSLEHAGVSAARNAGLALAQGEKVFFWDSDDSMEPDTIEQCLAFCEKHSVNSVLYGYANRTNGIKGIPHPHELKQLYRGREIITELMPHFLGHSFTDVNEWIKGKRGLRQGKENTALWHIMLDANTIKNNNLHFDTNLSLGEDTRFINEYMLHETSIGFLDKCLYYLTIRETGANLSSLKDVRKRLNDKLKLIKVRTEIDQKALRLYGINTHSYWEGTLVLSTIEVCLRLAQNNDISLKEKHAMLKVFMNNDAVKEASQTFKPAKGLKAIPFKIIQRGQAKALFHLLSLLPKSLANKITNQ